ncbi:hypothetical protein [Parahaliea aestuarii]|uniref:Uracil-DNA glycosylase-like domain-containing protein n=1 Tax=Parahaliea aestuarii TaxID=1852021 RepID=A0A5C8ZR18_9GAMM|nr:hypothetical protein [Parahaliea aestuarii]TXS89781.1 hypothetical protein FVW59_17405 [Parahaliea aestuarii]
MPQAHIIQQQAYLAALGIDCHVSRRDLPGAAPSRRHVIQAAVPAAPEPAPTAAEALVPADVGAMLRNPSATPVPPPAAANEKIEPQRALSPPVARFTLCAVFAGHWLWLESLPRAVLGRDQVKLIGAMAQALGAGGTPQVARFDWPPHNNRQLDLGEAAAQAALHSFLERQLDERGCRALIVLGEGALRHLGAARPAGAECVVAPAGSADMLADPGLKRGVWDAIRPLHLAESAR